MSRKPVFSPEPSRAVIALGAGGRGCVLHYDGPHLSYEIEDAGLYEVSDLGLDDAPPGVSVWEGTYVWCPGTWECPQDGDWEPRGTFRPLTDEEWARIRAGSEPWTKRSAFDAMAEQAGPLPTTVLAQTKP